MQILYLQWIITIKFNLISLGTCAIAENADGTNEEYFTVSHTHLYLRNWEAYLQYFLK